MSWSPRFDDPIPTPNGKPLTLVAESGGPTMFARIGVMQQLAVLTLRKASRIISGG
jgi:hypothetical protein